jgi:nicotinate-nucleotide pyrophosphorylase (carboxylating)
MITINDEINSLIEMALAEDLQGGVDITSHATIAPDQIGIAHYHLRTPGVIAGIPVAIAVLHKLGITEISAPITCAHENPAGTLILEARGNLRALMLAERTSLNFLTHLSGIATLTRAWVDQVAEYKAEIRDTRKTTPGWRLLEKYAVRMGGGTNHRLSLSDAALIKDNHILAAGGVLKAFSLVRAAYPDSEIEIEVDTLDQLREVLAGDPDLILLDNMSLQECAQAVALVDGVTKLEASGGLVLENAAAYAATGVDYLAVGALTHSAKALDIGLDLRMEH